MCSSPPLWAPTDGCRPVRVRHRIGRLRHPVSARALDGRNRRHPPGRRHASAPAAAREDADRARRLLRRALRAEACFCASTAFRALDRTAVEPFLDPDWSEPRRARRRARRGRRGADRRARQATSRLGDSDVAEMAFAVADDEQGRGIGRGCSSSSPLARAATGSRASSPTCWPSNRGDARASSRDAGFEVVARARRRARSSCASRSRRRATTQAASTQRDHVAVVASLRPFFRPASVAVIGASRRRGSIGGELFRNILAADFAGAAYPVNLKASRSPACAPTRRSRRSPSTIDLAVICVSRRAGARRGRGRARRAASRRSA